ALYAGGGFITAGGTSAPHIARWDGASWSALGEGTDNEVLALAVFDDGSGPALYAGGYFSHAGGTDLAHSAAHIARWGGSVWSQLGDGIDGAVRALAGLYDSAGPKLVAGGNFATAGGSAAKNVAAWNGTAWAPLGTGISDQV